MADEIVMFTIWIRNDSTKESTQIKGQGKSLPEAFKDGWDNANEFFRKGSSGDYIGAPHLGVKLPGGEVVFRSPASFASSKPYDREAEEKEFAAPICTAPHPVHGPRRNGL